MAEITVKLLGLPSVKLDGHDLLFPYKKCEALFYYLCCEKHISREEACVLLWEDDNEETAKKNLRHALYMIKKVFGCDVVASPSRSSLTLNPEMTFSIDIDDFFHKEDIVPYESEFLRGFVVKNAFNFDQWAESKEEQVKSYYLNALLKKIQDIPVSSIDSAEILAEKYIEIDPLDERVYETMLHKYDQSHLYHKGIQLYKRLYSTLNDELGIDPNKEIQKLYYSMLNHWSGDSDEMTGIENKDVRCRKAEFAMLEKIYDDFIDGIGGFVLISGENGIGKSYMLNEFLKNIVTEDAVVFKTSSFYVDQNSPLQTWNNLLMHIEEYILDNNISIPPHYINAIARLFPTFGMIITEDIDPSMQSEVGGNYGYMAAKNCIKRILSLISRTKRIILVFDDLQYMDAMSLDLLASVVSSQNDRILILSACQEEMGLQAEKFISSLIKNNMLTRISLKPFSFEDACLYTKMQFGKKMPDEATLRKIYRNSDGNPFFLAEIVAGLKNGLGDTVLSKNTQIVLNDRLNSISPEVRQLVDVLSIFKHSVPLDMLIYILNKTESEILHITEEFKYSSIVEEHSEGGKVVFSFKHNKMHEFAYERLSPSKKRILHNRAGYAYEKIYASNLTPYYKRIIYHFSIGENTPKALEYEVLELEQYINIIFDLYPVLSSDYEEKALQPDEIEERFDNIDARLHSIKSNPEISGKYDELEAKVLRARSRYYILRGNYTDGVRYNDMLMGSNTVKDSPLSLVKCMRTMIYYGIQTDNTALMKEYLDRAFSLLDKIDNPDETAIMYRLRGLYEILAGYPENAMPYLDQSIKILEKNVLNSSIYALNIAAAFNYMGEACRTQKNYEEAINHYHDAISLCEKNNCLVNPTFYTNMAVAHLQNRNKEKAYELFITAVSLYDVSTVLMKRSIAKSYAACYYCEKNDFPAAASSLKEADHFSKLLGSPSEQQIYEKNLNNLKAKYKNKLEQYL